MTDRQRRNVEWDVAEPTGSVPTWERAGIAVLMDIRRELQTLNRLLHCEHFQAIPRKLDSIRRNTNKPRKRSARDRSSKP